jgi:heat shock protein HtpX
VAVPDQALHLQERIDRNVFATWLCMTAVVVLLTATAWFLGQIWDFGFPAAVIGFTVAATSSLVAYFSGDTIVLGLLRARPADPDQHRELLNVTEEMAIASGLRPPRVYVITTPASNALATGRDPANAAIAVTSGLLERLSRNELQAVVAHEMSHIRHRDTLYAVVVAVLVGTIVTMSDIFWRTARIGETRTSRDNSDSKGEAAILIVGILLAALAPILAKIIQMAVSRRREYLADLGGADLTRNPGALADALEKIATDPDRFDIANRGVQHLFVLNPVDPLSSGQSAFADLFSTHPPLRERVRILRGLAHQSVGHPGVSALPA